MIELIKGKISSHMVIIIQLKLPKKQEIRNHVKPSSLFLNL